jgi:hypothetical protein
VNLRGRAAAVKLRGCSSDAASVESASRGAHRAADGNRDALARRVCFGSHARTRTRTRTHVCVRIRIHRRIRIRTRICSPREPCASPSMCSSSAVNARGSAVALRGATPLEWARAIARFLPGGSAVAALPRRPRDCRSSNRVGVRPLSGDVSARAVPCIRPRWACAETLAVVQRVGGARCRLARWAAEIALAPALAKSFLVPCFARANTCKRLPNAFASASRFFHQKPDQKWQTNARQPSAPT